VGPACFPLWHAEFILRAATLWAFCPFFISTDLFFFQLDFAYFYVVCCITSTRLPHWLVCWCKCERGTCVCIWACWSPPMELGWRNKKLEHKDSVIRLSTPGRWATLPGKHMCMCWDRLSLCLWVCTPSLHMLRSVFTGGLIKRLDAFRRSAERAAAVGGDLVTESPSASNPTLSRC